MKNSWVHRREERLTAVRGIILEKAEARKDRRDGAAFRGWAFGEFSRLLPLFELSLSDLAGDFELPVAMVSSSVPPRS